MDRSLQWDIFCQVIDNFGDIGVCWRLASDVANRGHRVRLWLDDASALRWMAPRGCEGVEVLPWDAEGLRDLSILDTRPPDVIVEAFGCEVAPEFIAACAGIDWAGGRKPSWINLEYLSAEAYVERCHAKPSPVHSGPLAGWTKWFFFPGFTPRTGGLLREPDLARRQAAFTAFDRAAWLQGLDIPFDAGKPEKLVSLFCYEPTTLPALLQQLATHGLQGQPVRLLVTAGRAAQAVKAVFNDQTGLQPNQYVREQLSISYLGILSQRDFDHLLWACDLNFVRGEDSLVRAIWASKPLVWQLYPQTDNAHAAKLDAFLNLIGAPPSLRRFMTAWNNPGADVPRLEPESWADCFQSAADKLRAQHDLGTQLIRFVTQNRSEHATAAH
jgi:uncharacterized repeat protein (TIGR03837 family)